MKHSLIFCLFAGVMLGSAATGTEIARKGAKLGQWSMDFEASAALAKEKELPMLINFTGSDWCGWCQIMDKNVLSKEDWLKFAEKNLVLVTIDFPQDTSIVPAAFVEGNKALQAKFGVQGFPTYVLLEPDAQTELARLGAGQDKTPESFIGEVNDALRFRPASIEAKAASLGERGQAYKDAIKNYQSAMDELEAWIKTGPQRSPENDKLYEGFQTKIAAARKAIDAF
jgi:thiol-disulfide isomerase/thioredoxin